MMTVAGGSALIPGKNHIGSENLVLVEEIGDPLGQLQSLGTALVLMEITPKGIKGGIFFHTAGEQCKNGEKHDIALERLRFRHSGQHRLDHRSDEGLRKGKVQVGGNAQLTGDRQGQPALHAPALDHDRLRGERIP